MIICRYRQTIIGQAIICRLYECQMIIWRSDEGEVLLWSQAIVLFVFFKELGETLQVNSVQAVNVLAAGTGGLDDCDRLAH